MFDFSKIQAVIFDMDGVIFDSEKIYYDAFFVAANKHHVEATSEFVHQFAGKTSQACQIILQNLLDHDVEKTQQFWHDWGQARLNILAKHGLEFKEGFLETFAAIKASGRTIALVTSANRIDMEENFARSQPELVDDFAHIITIEDIQHPKPHPQPYQTMMTHLGYSPEQCVVIEDSLSGVNAAVSAGANTIMISEHLRPDAALATQLTYLGESHADILAFLKQHGL